MPPIHRTIKNKVKNYTFAEVKVREATSNDPWGPSTALMSEISDMTYNIVAFAEIMQMVWKRVNDSGKNWRHVYKSLVLLDYLIKNGNEKVIQQSKESILMIQTLKDFQYFEEGKDHGQCVREKSKQLVALLKDDGRIQNERTKAHTSRERYAANTGAPLRSGMTRSISEKNLSSKGRAAVVSPGARDSNATPATEADEDIQLQLALAMSKEEHDEDLKRREGDEKRLQMAIEESKKLSEQRQQQYRAADSGLYDNGDGLLDLATESTNHSSLPSSLTWDGQLSSGAASAGAIFDPWGAPPAMQSKQPSAWDAPLYDNPSTFSQQPSSYQVGVGAPVAAPRKNDPWLTSGLSASSNSNALGQPVAGSTTGGAWGPSGSMFSSQGGVPPIYGNAINGSSHAPISDNFDLFSSSRKTSPPQNADVYQNFSLDPLNDTKPMGGDIWDMKGLDGALKGPSSGGGKNTAEKFLGANANLVDLDDLISKPPPPSTLSPFSMTTTTRTQSPAAQLFANRALEEDRNKSVPLNQMMMSGGAPASSTPLVPWGAPQPMGYQPPGVAMGMSSMYPPSQPMMFPPQTAATTAQYPQQHNPFM